MITSSVSCLFALVVVQLGIVFLSLPAIASLLPPSAPVCTGPGSPCGGGGSASTGNNAQANTGAGNPINVLNGNKFQVETDMAALPGVLGLELVRYYNSLSSGVDGTVGLVGRGWRLGYETRLVITGAGSGASDTVALDIDQADGTVIKFRPAKNSANKPIADQWQSVDGHLGSIRLVRSTSNTAGTSASSDDYIWTWGAGAGANSGRQLTFNRDGQLLRIAAPTGEFVTLDYTPKGWLNSVTDPQGRRLSINYMSQTLIAQSQQAGVAVFTGVQSIDTPVGLMRYRYGSTAQQGTAPASAARKQMQLANLTAVVMPSASTPSTPSTPNKSTVPAEGIQRQYHYEDARHPTLLTGISIKGTGSDGVAMHQRLVTWGYDQYGRANLSVKGEPARLATDAQGKVITPRRLAAGTGIEQVTLQWFDADNKNKDSSKNKANSTVVQTNSLGQETRYVIARINNEPRLMQATGAGCASCAPVNVKYGYDKQGRLIEQTQLDQTGKVIAGSAASTLLDDQGRMLRITQGKWRIVRYEYDSQSTQPSLIARPSVVNGKEHQLRMAYNAFGQIITVTETGYSPLADSGDVVAEPVRASQLERTTRYTYSTINNRSLLTRIDGPLPNGSTNSPMDSDVTQFEWEKQGSYVIGITQPTGLTQKFEYGVSGGNPSGLLIAVTDTLGIRSELNWLPGQSEPDQIKRAGVHVTVERDSMGRPTRYRRNDGVSTAVAYDPQGAMVSYTLPDGEVKQMRRDTENRPIYNQWQNSVGRVLVGGSQIEWVRQAANSLTTAHITEASGVLTTVSLDPQKASNSSVRGKDTDQLKQTESFDPAQHLLSLQRNDAITRIRDDGADNLSIASRSLTLPSGAKHRQWVDDFGRVVRLESPESGVHRAAYDQADRQTERWDSQRRSSARYDAIGRLTQLTHVINARTLVQNSSALVQSVVQAEEQSVWIYKGALLVRQSSSQEDIQFVFDGSGRMTEERLRVRRQSGENFAEATDLKTKTQSESLDWLTALITRYERDEFGRIVRIYLPEGAVLSQTYGKTGEIEALNLQEPASTWWQVALRWIWAEQGTSAVISEIRHSSSRGLQGYRHAASNASLANAQFDAAGRLIRWSDGPFSAALSFNANAQLAELKTEAPERVGQVLISQAAPQATKAPFNLQEQTLAYDPFGRLNLIRSAGQTQAFKYDANNNRISQSSGDTTQLSFAMAGQSDRLVETRDNQGQIRTRYEYNDAGEPIQIADQGGPTKTLHYNSLGQIALVEQGGKPLAQYAYNGARQRVAKTVYREQQNGATNYFTWHGGLLDAELDAHGRVQRRTLYLNLRPVALLVYGYAHESQNRRTKSSQRLAIHGDHLGTPQAITDSAQRVVWLARYDVFGRAKTQGLPVKQITAQNLNQSSDWIRTAHAAQSEQNQSETPFEFHLRFAGQFEDTETGWYYNWHRYYDPQSGRYLTPDPIGLRGGDNAYAYAGGDPLGAIDPSGLRTFVVGGVIQIRPEDSTVPSVDIPNTVGADGFTPRNPFFHTYDVSAATRLSACKVGQSLRDNPTPGIDTPASTNGTRNNAGAIPFLGNQNFVRSFFIPSPNPALYTDITVNYTIAGQHNLHEGYVLRYGQINSNGSITMRSYGEGQAFAQNNALRSVWYPRVVNVWQENYREIERNPSSCGCPS